MKYRRVKVMLYLHQALVRHIRLAQCNHLEYIPPEGSPHPGLGRMEIHQNVTKAKKATSLTATSTCFDLVSVLNDLIEVQIILYMNTVKANTSTKARKIPECRV